jgi:hypothetical protein
MSITTAPGQRVIGAAANRARDGIADTFSVSLPGGTQLFKTDDPLYDGSIIAAHKVANSSVQSMTWNVTTGEGWPSCGIMATFG